MIPLCLSSNSLLLKITEQNGRSSKEEEWACWFAEESEDLVSFEEET